MPILPQLASSVFITLVCLLVAPTIAQAKRDIEGQVFIVTKGSENVKLGLVPIWLVSDSEMKDLAKQAVEMANATALKEEVDKMVKEVDAVEARAEKELSSEAFQKVKLAAGEEKQTILKSFEPLQKLAQRGESLINKLEKQKQGIDTGEIFSKVMLHSEFSIKIMIGLLSEKESDVESDADGKFKLSGDGNADWVVAYSQRTLGKIGQSELRNSEQYYWLLEVPKKKSQLFLSSNNCDISEAEAKLRSMALQEAPGLFGASKKLSKETLVPTVAGKGETQKVYDEEKREQDRISAEKENMAAAQARERVLNDTAFKSQLEVYLKNEEKACRPGGAYTDFISLQNDVKQAESSCDILLAGWPADFDPGLKKSVIRVRLCNAIAVSIVKEWIRFREGLSNDILVTLPADFSPVFRHKVGEEGWKKISELLGSDLIAPDYRGYDPNGDFSGKQYLSRKNSELLLKNAANEFEKVRETAAKLLQ